MNFLAVPSRKDKVLETRSGPTAAIPDSGDLVTVLRQLDTGGTMPTGRVSWTKFKSALKKDVLYPHLTDLSPKSRRVVQGSSDHALQKSLLKKRRAKKV